MRKVILFILLLLVLLTSCDTFKKKEAVAVVEPSPEPEEVVIKDDTTDLDLEENKPQFIDTFTFEPACKSAQQGVEVHVKVNKVPASYRFLIKEPGEQYREIFERSGREEDYVYFTSCKDCDESVWDFSLEQDKLYILRAEFDHISTIGSIDVSDEILINTTINSTLFRKECESKIKLVSW